MSGSYAYTRELWLSLVTVVLLVALAAFGWRRRSVRGAVPFAAACLFSALWAAGSFMEYAVGDVATKVFWIKFQVVWQLPATTALTCFVLEYAWPGRWLTRRNLALLSIVPLLLLLVVLTNDLHHLMWIGFAYDGSVLPLKGPAAWYLLGYGYVLGIANILVVAWMFLRWPQYRWPMAMVLIAQVGGRVVYLLERLYIVRTNLPLDMLAVLVVFVAWAIVLFGLRILNPVPLARQAVIAQMRDGLLVLDAEGRVASLNPAAQAILGAAARDALGQPFQDLLPVVPDAGGGGLAAGTEPIEIRLGTEPQARYYLLEISTLKDVRGLAVGSLLLLRDVTERRQAETQNIEQQRALAALNERERLARELHDSLGQVLGYASFQVDAAAKLSRDGQSAAAAAQLDRLGTVIRNAHADVRQHILDLRSVPSLQQPFFSVVKEYLQGFTSNYEIRTHLTVGQEVGETPFAPEAQLQVFRILQEALSNARKHGRAHHVQVTFAAEGGWVCMTIQDNGCGFAPEGGAMVGGRHFGLQFMQERAGQIGGSLQVQSAPGAGARVVLAVPGKEL